MIKVAHICPGDQGTVLVIPNPGNPWNPLDEALVARAGEAGRVDGGLKNKACDRVEGCWEDERRLYCLGSSKATREIDLSGLIVDSRNSHLQCGKFSLGPPALQFSSHPSSFPAHLLCLQPTLSSLRTRHPSLNHGSSLSCLLQLYVFTRSPLLPSLESIQAELRPRSMQHPAITRSTSQWPSLYHDLHRQIALCNLYSHLPRARFPCHEVSLLTFLHFTQVATPLTRYINALVAGLQ